MKFRFILLLKGACFLAIFSLSALPAVAEPRYGLWVEAEGKNRPFKSKEDFERFLDFTQEPTLTDLYCQVYRGGRSWFHSTSADETPYKLAKEQGFDPLGDTIAVAHARGQKVHAWLNVMRIEANLDVPIYKDIGPTAVLVDNYGNSLLTYRDYRLPKGQLGHHFQLDTPGVWMDPGVKRVREHLLKTVRDLIAAHPDVDGIHLDMIRFPFGMVMQPTAKYPRGLDFGYSTESIQNFLRLSAPVGKPEAWRFRKYPRGKEWDEWRRSQITEVVQEIRALLKEIAPGKELSGAVVAWPDRAYNKAFQDWRRWLIENTLDTLVPMNYVKDVPTSRLNSKQAVMFKGDGQVIVGLGAWLLADRIPTLIAQANAALKTGADGVTLFSYSNLLSPNGEKVLREVGEAIRGDIVKKQTIEAAPATSILKPTQKPTETQNPIEEKTTEERTTNTITAH